MSRSLSISCERVPETAADPLERRTWAAVRIYAGGRCITRWLERQTQEELDAIYIPAFPLARWIVSNWWALLNEACPDDVPPGPAGIWTAAQRAWLQRHCLRAADSGLFLPRLSIWNDGHNLCAHWSADPDSTYLTMPGQFLYGSFVTLCPSEAEDALRSFVATVLRWIETDSSSQAQRLRDNWAAITEADAAEAAFCRAAGRMGLDPYAIERWPDPKLAKLIETSLSEEHSEPMVEDLLSAAAPTQAEPLWNWVREVRQSAGLGQSRRSPLSPLDFRQHAGQAGCVAAARLRHQIGLSSAAALPPLAEVARRAGLGDLQFQQHNSLVDTAIKAAVGWEGERPLIVEPHQLSAESERFNQARGLFHAAYLCERGPRLVTRSHDWDQQASRGFAAELLAPRAALLEILGPEVDEDELPARISELARQYQVNPELIRRQLQNAQRYGAAAK